MMESRRSYDKNGDLQEILVVLKPYEARNFVHGYENQENLVIEMNKVIREALELVEGK